MACWALGYHDNFDFEIFRDSCSKYSCSDFEFLDAVQSGKLRVGSSCYCELKWLDQGINSDPTRRCIVEWVKKLESQRTTPCCWCRESVDWESFVFSDTQGDVIFHVEGGCIVHCVLILLASWRVNCCQATIWGQSNRYHKCLYVCCRQIIPTRNSECVKAWERVTHWSFDRVKFVDCIECENINTPTCRISVLHS